MAKDKDKPAEEPKVQTPLEWLRSKFEYEYVKHQPQHKKPKGN